MATVTGFTAERMLAIENSTVVDGDIVGDNLILLMRDGTPINAGNVRGPQGLNGGLLANELAGSVNLNTLTGAGSWIQSDTAEAVSGTNYPVPQPGILQVLANGAGTVVRQTYTVVGTSVWAGVVYSRYLFGGVWSTWLATGGTTPYLCRHKLAPTVPANTSAFTIDFDGSDALEGGMQYAAGVTTVPRAGKYAINAMIHMQSTATTGFPLIIRKNSVIWRQLNFKHDGANASYEINSTLFADAGDTFDIRFNVPATSSTLYGVAPGIRYTCLDITFTGP